ncbi:MAG: YbhB/YbcL family Raf kinase inhibitor-like protein [Isosphaeraceae bacterium]
MKRCVWLAGFLIGCGSGAPDDPPGEPAIHLESPAFGEEQAIPRAHSCDGPNVSPPLAWSGVPDEARSLVLICEDPDAPLGTWCHWILYDVPPRIRELRQDLPTGVRIPLTPEGPAVRQGVNDFGNTGYGGPCPPSGTHRYVFHLYALDEPPVLPESPKRSQVLQAIRGHVVATGKLVGLYSR